MENNTLQEAKKIIDDGIKKGVRCPCCNQLCKLYHTALRANNAILLIAIYKLQISSGREWVHILNELNPNNGDYAKLRHWGLLKPRGDAPEKDVKSSGYWSITEKGKKFVLGQILVPSYVYLFNNKKYGESETMTDIKSSLGKKFSWRELMGGYLSEFKAQTETLPRPVSQFGFYQLDENHFIATGRNNKKYNVAFTVIGIGKKWTCECEAYRFSLKKTCKHIQQIQKYLKEKGVAEELKAQTNLI